jgi:hypothetical protein
MLKTWGFTPNSDLVSFIASQYQTGFGNRDTWNYVTPRTVENLLRVAQKIPQDDMFWESCDVSVGMVSALYASIKGKDKFRKIKEQLISWVDSRPAIDPWADLILVGLDECTTMRDMREFLHKIEESGVAPEFFEYLKSVEFGSDE